MKYMKRFLARAAETAETSPDGGFRSFHSSFTHPCENKRAQSERRPSTLDQAQRIRSLSLLAEPQEVWKRLKGIRKNVCSCQQDALELALSLVMLDQGIDPQDATEIVWNVLQDIERKRIQRAMPSEIVVLEKQLSEFKNQGIHETSQAFDTEKTLQTLLDELYDSWFQEEQEQIEKCRFQLKGATQKKSTRVR